MPGELLPLYATSETDAELTTLHVGFAGRMTALTRRYALSC
jgi:hypothetical protein